jgi:AsmA protein
MRSTDSMKPWIRKLLLALALLVLLFGAVLVWLVSTFDPNAYKGLAIDWMKTHRARTLAIDGPIKLSVFPRLAVQLSAVKLSEKGRADEFAALDEASLSVAVLPLLRRQLVVDHVSARGLRLVYRRDAQGKTNIDDLLAGDAPPPGAPASPASQAASGAPLRFDVSSVQLDDLRLSLRDERDQLSGEVTLNSLHTGRLADQVESPVKLQAELAMKAPAVKGRLSGETKLTLLLAQQGVKLRDMQLGWQGDAFGVQAMDVKIQGALGYDGQRGTLDAQDLDLGLGATLGSLKLVNSRVQIKHFAFDPAARNLSLNALQVKLAGTQGGQPLSATLDWPELNVKGEALTGSALSGKLSLEGPTAVDASFKSAAPGGSFDMVKVPGFEATLKGSMKGTSGQRELAGTVRADLQLQPAKSAFALDALAAQLKIQEPSLQPLVLDMRGKADASPQAAHWTLAGQINANPFRSEGAVTLAGTPITVKASANFEALDLNRLLPPSSTAPAPAPAATDKPAADTPVDLSPLRALQGEFSLRIGSFAYQTYRVSDAALDASLQGGMLRVSKLYGKTWGGVLDATAFADARASRVAVKATATGVNVNTLLKDVAKKDILEGTGRVVADIETAGRSVNEMKARLKGTAALQLRDGAIKGVNLAKSLRQAKAALSMKQDSSQKATQAEKTDFSELTASFVITDGIARNADLDAKSPFLRLNGSGTVDIGRSRIDYTARATVANTTKGQDGADLAALKGVTVPVLLTGPLDAIDWKIQWSQIAAQVLKSEVTGKAEEKLKESLRGKLGLPSAASGAASGPQPSTKDQLKDKLKGLFK